jgi:uncharacterized membrane protein
MMVLLTLFACGNKTPTEADTSADMLQTDTAGPAMECALNWDGWANGFFSTYCRSCHSASTAERHGAPSGVDFDTREDAIQWSDRIRVRVLDLETMPLGGGVIETDLEPLDLWLQCVEDRS